MANRIRIACRDFLMSCDRVASSMPRSAPPVEVTPIERRLPFGTPGVHTLRVLMKCHSVLHKSLLVIALVVFLVALYRITAPDIETVSNIPLSEIVALVAVVSLLMLMNIILSRSIIRQIKGNGLLELFGSADDTTRREMCGELERLYNSNRVRLAKHDRIGFLADPLFSYVMPNSTKVLDALEDTLEAWKLSMNPAFRRHVQNCIDELTVDERVAIKEE